MIYFIYRISIIVCFGLASLIAVWCSVGFSFLRRGSHLELVMVCFRNSIEKFLKIMSLGILESLPSGHVCHVFATVYIYNISYLYCIIQTKISMQTSLFRARCEGWGLVERHSKGWLFDDMSSQPFLWEKKLTFQQTPTSLSRLICSCFCNS